MFFSSLLLQNNSSSHLNSAGSDKHSLNSHTTNSSLGSNVTNMNNNNNNNNNHNSVTSNGNGVNGLANSLTNISLKEKRDAIMHANNHHDVLLQNNGHHHSSDSNKILNERHEKEKPVVKSKPKELDGYVGFANLPNQVYRKAVKKGFEFTLMVVGKFHWEILFG